jgi:hypothetical protein
VILLIALAEGFALFGAWVFVPSYLHARFGISLTAAGVIAGLFGLGGLLYTVTARSLLIALQADWTIGRRRGGLRGNRCRRRGLGLPSGGDYAADHRLIVRPRLAPQAERSTLSRKKGARSPLAHPILHASLDAMDAYLLAAGAVIDPSLFRRRRLAWMAAFRAEVAAHVKRSCACLLSLPA